LGPVRRFAPPMPPNPTADPEKIRCQPLMH
jgi:hypothetical protein